MGLADSLLAGYSSEEEGHESDVELQDADDQQISFQQLISVPDLSSITDIRKYSHNLPRVNDFVEKLRYYEKQDSKIEDSLLQHANDLLDDLNEEIGKIYSFITVHYKPVWPELDDLLRNPYNYARTVRIVGGDPSKLIDAPELFEQYLRKDEILGLTVSASVLRQSSHSHHLDQHHLKLISDACDLLLELEGARTEIKNHVSRRAKSIAPNVTALVGPTVAAQFLSVYGLEGLCKVPSCNIPSMGVNRSSFMKGTVGTRNKGYLYYCDLVQSVPEDLRVKAVRGVAAKLVLAARVDFSNAGKSVSDDSFGVQTRQQLSEHLDKLASPPDAQPIKPLPKPVDQKSKKRAGRRFRKQKEKMEMSELEKAQNRMAFGEQEETKYDAFGEEIGMGMIGKLSARAIASRSRPQLSKSAASKLEKFSGNKPAATSKVAQLLDDEKTARKRQLELPEDTGHDRAKVQKTLPGAT
ncbi:hypothetical protein KL942_000474 [Ogataea angusta]|uniref:Nop domain-containing protein n=1 Tax=Pichia angusta TaxID=870730 RepID=A0ABQ7S3Y8_PICAN|nr:hypothetical protein KL943_001962 [Ogataea angusta]KAG7843378.1 hypothetical protein KL942_000474 [Ogataea angusta]KAG7851595.1 hypothetical protein KL941_001264 [Ogataea angusta]KAG7852469.1 hypothetical protein KL940_000170 [Ogataea angusta]KAG7863784.1 hypothetical protein KL919_001099 [Ogataea angusta]